MMTTASGYSCHLYDSNNGGSCKSCVKAKGSVGFAGTTILL